MAIELDKKHRTAAIESIERFFDLNREEHIGSIQATELLDFFIAEIGPSIYNLAVRDTQGRLQERVLEVDIEIHEEEFSYWRKQARRG
jgi:uncharacterized protein (DUF2164 family)